MATIRGKKAPSLTLEDAESIIREINSLAGAESLSEDMLPEIVNSKKTSSLFIRKLVDLKKYGLIKDTGNNTVAVTSLGMKIITPMSEGESEEAKKDSLLRIEPLQQLLSRFPGGRLPQDDTALSNILQREYRILPAHIKKWLEYIRVSFETLQSLLEKQGREDEGEIGQEQESKQEVSQQADKGFFNLQLPLKSGSIAKIIIPNDATMADKEMILMIIDAVKFKEDDLLDD